MNTPLRSVLVLSGLLALAARGDPSPEMRSKIMSLAPGQAKVFRVDLDLIRGWPGDFSSRLPSLKRELAAGDSAEVLNSIRLAADRKNRPGHVISFNRILLLITSDKEEYLVLLEFEQAREGGEKLVTMDAGLRSQENHMSMCGEITGPAAQKLFHLFLPPVAGR